MSNPSDLPRLRRSWALRCKFLARCTRWRFNRAQESYNSSIRDKSWKNWSALGCCCCYRRCCCSWCCCCYRWWCFYRCCCCSWCCCYRCWWWCCDYNSNLVKARIFFWASKQAWANCFCPGQLMRTKYKTKIEMKKPDQQNKSFQHFRVCSCIKKT